jgi:hypothetical protein
MSGDPKLRVCRVRDGSLLDESSLKLLADMAAKLDFQVWIERVDSSGKTGFVIAEGQVVGAPPATAVTAANAKYPEIVGDEEYEHEEEEDLVDDLAKVPPSMVGPARCPACGTLLFRAETGWVCPTGLDHTGIISDVVLAGRIRDVMPKRPPKGWRKRAWTRWSFNGPNRVLRLLKQEWKKRVKQKRN